MKTLILAAALVGAVSSQALAQGGNPHPERPPSDPFEWTNRVSSSGSRNYKADFRGYSKDRPGSFYDRGTHTSRDNR